MTFTRECEYCYSAAHWCAETARGARYVCQRHYDVITADTRAVSLASLSPAAVALIRESFGRGLDDMAARMARRDGVES